MAEGLTAIEDELLPPQFRPALGAIAAFGRELSESISRNGIRTILKTAADAGDPPGLNRVAGELLVAKLKGSGVRWYATDAAPDVVEIDADGELALSAAPIDGSAKVDANVALGTVFGLYAAGETAEASFLRPGRQLIAAGYIFYGPHTSLVVSFGDGVLKFTLDRATGVFRAVEPHFRIPDQCFEYAIEASNYRHWPAPVRAFIDDCVAGHLGPSNENFTMRWVASLVAETHRILHQGGVYLCPADERAGRTRGRLHRVFECAPIAFLVEQAGGKATDGSDRILDQTAASLHERTPFVFGSGTNVDRVAAYFDLPETETSALFGKRGLFRADHRTR